MSEPAYKWKANLYKVDAQTAGRYLRNLEERDGEIKPEVMVDEAKDTEAALHPCFEWDDQKAAENYRVGQAKGVLRNIVVVYQKDDEKEEPLQVRAFVHVKQTDEEESKYIHVETAMSDEILKRQLLESALRELDEFRRKYHGLIELSELFGVIEQYKELRKLA
jgi:hypothetical protein